MQLIEKTRLVYITIILNVILDAVWLMITLNVIEFSISFSITSSIVRTVMWISLVIFFMAIYDKQKEGRGKNV